MKQTLATNIEATQTLYPQINTCYTVPCASTGEHECLWTDWLLDNSLNGEQARQYACIRRSDTTCSWYRGGPPPEKDFLDLADPWPVVLTFSILHLTPAKSWETFPAFAYVAQIWHASYFVKNKCGWIIFSYKGSLAEFRKIVVNGMGF